MKKLAFILVVAAAFAACSTTQTSSSASASANEARHSTPEQRPAMPEPSGVSPTGTASRGW